MIANEAMYTIICKYKSRQCINLGTHMYLHDIPLLQYTMRQTDVHEIQCTLVALCSVNSTANWPIYYNFW